MDRFTLRKGTVVKHGTNLSRLRSILSNGLHPAAARHEMRISNEHQPEIQGIYVGNLTAYFGAYAAYSAELVPFMSTQDYLRAMLCLSDLHAIKTFELTDAPLDLPVVLRIRIKEDCELYGDEDYVQDGAIPVGQKVPTELLISDAKRVWDKWQTGCLIRSGGIPADWIEAIEHPRLGTLEASNRLHKDTWADCELLIAGVMQASQKKEPAVILAPYTKRYGRDCLSQCIPATESGIQRIEQLKGLSSNHNRYFNHVHITQAIEHMAANYGIPLHRAPIPTL